MVFHPRGARCITFQPWCLKPQRCTAFSNTGFQITRDWESENSVDKRQTLDFYCHQRQTNSGQYGGLSHRCELSHHKQMYSTVEKGHQIKNTEELMWQMHVWTWHQRITQRLRHAEQFDQSWIGRFHFPCKTFGVPLTIALDTGSQCVDTSMTLV